MKLHKLTRSKIENFFHSDDAETLMHAAGKIYESKLEEVHQDFMYKFRDYLVDEYSLFYEEIVQDGITREVRALIRGDKGALSRYALAPNSWGIPTDHEKCRKMIVENNKDIIKDTYVKSLEEELKRALELNQTYRDRI